VSQPQAPPSAPQPAPPGPEQGTGNAAPPIRLERVTFTRALRVLADAESNVAGGRVSNGMAKHLLNQAAQQKGWAPVSGSKTSRLLSSMRSLFTRIDAARRELHVTVFDPAAIANNSAVSNYIQRRESGADPEAVVALMVSMNNTSEWKKPQKKNGVKRKSRDQGATTVAAPAAPSDDTSEVKKLRRTVKELKNSLVALQAAVSKLQADVKGMREDGDSIASSSDGEVDSSSDED